MDSARTAGLTAFHWDVQPAAGALVQDLLTQILERSPTVQRLSGRLLHETGTRLVDWIDHLEIPDLPGLDGRLRDAGFQVAAERAAVFRHPGGLFPPVVLTTDGSYALHLKVESVSDALQAHEAAVPIAGAPWAPLRRARLAADQAQVWVCERHGYQGFDLPTVSPERTIHLLHHHELFLTPPARLRATG